MIIKITTVQILITAFGVFIRRVVFMDMKGMTSFIVFIVKFSLKGYFINLFYKNEPNGSLPSHIYGS